MCKLVYSFPNVIVSVPALYEKYYNTTDGPAVDEWDLSTLMTADGSLDELEDHYKTFIVSPNVDLPLVYII